MSVWVRALECVRVRVGSSFRVCVCVHECEGKMESERIAAVCKVECFE